MGWQQQEDNPDRKAKFAQAAAIASEIYDLYYEILREASFPGLPPRETFPVVTPAMASQGSSVGSRGSSLSPEWLPTDRFVPPSRSPPKPQPVPPPTQDPPQGQTLQYYKDHGYSQFMREVQLMFLSGSFSHEPCRVVRYNGKNNALCFFPETGASHYISCQIPLMWTRLESTQG